MSVTQFRFFTLSLTTFTAVGRPIKSLQSILKVAFNDQLKKLSRRIVAFTCSETNADATSPWAGVPVRPNAPITVTRILDNGADGFLSFPNNFAKAFDAPLLYQIKPIKSRTGTRSPVSLIFAYLILTAGSALKWRAFFSLTQLRARLVTAPKMCAGITQGERTTEKVSNSKI